MWSSSMVPRYPSEERVPARPFHEYLVSKQFFVYESWRTCTHAINQTIQTQTHWHDRLTLVPIPENKEVFFGTR